MQFGYICLICNTPPFSQHLRLGAGDVSNIVTDKLRKNQDVTDNLKKNQYDNQRLPSVLNVSTIQMASQDSPPQVLSGNDGNVPSHGEGEVNALDPESASHQVLRRKLPRRAPTKQQHLQTELGWARLGYPSNWQMDVLPGWVKGLPKFFPHPFTRQATTSKVNGPGRRFFLEFSFPRTSMEDYTRPDKTRDRVIQSYDGYNSFLVIVDKFTRYVWVFLM